MTITAIGNVARSMLGASFAPNRLPTSIIMGVVEKASAPLMASTATCT